MTDFIDPILDVLSDGEFHSLQEIRQKISLNDKQFEEVMHFLQQFTFLTPYAKRHPTVWDPIVHGARLEGPMLRFLQKIKELEK